MLLKRPVLLWVFEPLPPRLRLHTDSAVIFALTESLSHRVIMTEQLTDIDQNYCCDPVQHLIWQWQGLDVHYQVAGTTGPALVLIHGFGASSDHWRQNISALAEDHRVYAIDLLGFGQSAKPAPEQELEGRSPYCFETWGAQMTAFLEAVVKTPAFLVGNSIGCVVALQTAVLAPQQVQGLMLLDCALRQIHDRKLQSQPPMRRLGRPLLKKLVQSKPIVHWLFQQLAQPKVVKKVLQSAYGNNDAVTDELVELLIQPSREPGAADVFWAFINNFTGPLPEDLLPQVSCPVEILWGTADPWEPIELGRALADFPAVERFVPLEGVGHCPQDEVPEQVNPRIQDWVARHASSISSATCVANT